MSASSSKLAGILSTHDLKLVCPDCAVRKEEITYQLKPCCHQCPRNILLCRAIGGDKWRPVLRRPEFPTPSKYAVCYFFKEGFGCSKHLNRCTFARSSEEAAVWNFEKTEKLNHLSLLYLIAQYEGGSVESATPEAINSLLKILDLKVVCDMCCVEKEEITYAVKHVNHKCKRDQILTKGKTSDKWRPVSERPVHGNFGRNVSYEVCHYFSEGKGCTQHGQKCTYAKSHEEAIIWNYLREHKIDQDSLIKLIIETAPCVAETPESIAQSILKEFTGEFIELCRDCFHECPQKLTPKRWNDTCAADAAHTWVPVLVYHLSEYSRKHIYSQVRPLPQNCQFDYCRHVHQNKPCWHKAGHCKSAQSEVEMAVWKAEQSGPSIRSHLLQFSRRGPMQHRQTTMYCKVCLLVLNSPESFFKHCSSSEHAQLLSDDTTTKWTGRQPPHNRRAEFWMCERPQTCEYGNNCLKAHSMEELQEWMMRAKQEEEHRHNVAAEGLMGYSDKLLEEYKDSANEVYILSEQVDDVIISCNNDLTVECEETQAELQWTFTVETERQLLHVALLKQEPGASFSLDDHSSIPCVYSSGGCFRSGDTSYDITVLFACINPGQYEQWLVLDFDMRPVLLRKLRVRVGLPLLDDTEPPTLNHAVAIKNGTRWHRGNRILIRCLTRTEDHEMLLKKYKPPQTNILYTSSKITETQLNPTTYKEIMHRFLYKEEQAEDEFISRLSVCGEITTLDEQCDMTGGLTCALSVPYSLTLDSSGGQALKRSVQSALIAPASTSDHNTKVYEARILHDKMCENQMFLHLSKKCCMDLSLKSNETYQMEVQFQLDRDSFCIMHRAIDMLPDTKRVLPDLQTCGVPEYRITHEKLSTKQQSAVNFILGKVQKLTAPLLIYGPFGTGKTFTLATAARELCKQAGNKVLICTHTNSSADLYIRDHLHPFIDKNNDEIRPIRIKAGKQGRAIFATDEITLKYCLLSKDCQSFQLPTKPVLDQHKVIITTTRMARHLQDLKLPDGYFTHILIDEASQMLECDALIPLGLAGPNTRIVLAGDHMQMGPKLFSVDDYHRSDQTILTRLFHYYQGQNCEAAQKSRVIFSENYRSTKEIVDFVSKHFYIAKHDVVKAVGNIPAPTSGHSLQFHYVRGECVLDSASRSWYNKAEVFEVVKVVKEILALWPSTWETKSQDSMCVLSEGLQIHHIRRALLKKNLGNISVESHANVQGKQFRVVIIATVQTRDSLKSSHLHGLEMFNDVRVLNTTMTRAQSLVVVVGDAAGLCCFGRCAAVWKSYIDHCISNNSVAPKYFSNDFFERDIKETARFQKPEHVEEASSHSDTILQEMKDAYEQMKTEYSSDEDGLDFQDSYHRTGESYKAIDAERNLLELCQKQPDKFKQGKLVRQTFNKGYVIPVDNPTKSIEIKTMANLGQAFSGDKVIVQTSPIAKVLRVTEIAQSARLLLCNLEDEDYCKTERTTSESHFIKRKMIPIIRSAPKICILISKKKRSSIPVWHQMDNYWFISHFHSLNQNSSKSFVFQVQVINWREDCVYPLGKVMDVTKVDYSLDAGLRLLKHEFEVKEWESDDSDDCRLENINKELRIDETNVITFTVDPEQSKDLDDAISVRDVGDHYELGIHIADVASFLSPSSKLDKCAQKRGTSYYCQSQDPTHMFPSNLSTGKFSLLEGKDRRVVSLIVTAEKNTHKMTEKPYFQLSLINSDSQMSYEDAEKVITERYRDRDRFDTVNDCVAVAYHFAREQRKLRLKEWPYAQPDDDRVAGRRKSHLMIEELNMFFNIQAAERLTHFEKTRNYTPLRCQKNPDNNKLMEFKNKWEKYIPLSFCVRHRVEHENQIPEHKNFRILNEVWRDIQSAIEADDMDKMLDLIAADDIHPLLEPVVEGFRGCLSRAYVTRANSSPEEPVGHYSVCKKFYTQASSPIRRYMDIVLQRLLHTFISNSHIDYKRKEIDALCKEFQHSLQNAKKFEQSTEQVYFAVSMRKQNAPKLAVVSTVDPAEDSFTLFFPYNKSLFPRGVAVMYKDLQLEDIPTCDQVNLCTLTWRRRIYAADQMQIKQEIKRLQRCGPFIELPMVEWKEIIDALDEEDWELAKMLLREKMQQMENQDPHDAPQANTASPDTEDDFVDIALMLQPGDTLEIQMTCKMDKRCHIVPAVQLLNITPMFQICVDHVQSPVLCFSNMANTPTKYSYHTTSDYINIWKPLCEMESVSNAVEDSESILIENLEVIFKKGEREDMLKGSFSLPQTWMEEWEIEWNLSGSLLCIRKRGLQSTLENSTQVDPKEYTWVAHGVINKLEKSKSPKNEITKVEFNVKHLPMETIPDCVFQTQTCFAVEFIPKLVPDIRKEIAVSSLSKACDLVKRIALGEHIPGERTKCSVGKWTIMKKELPKGLPKLNDSQYRAVEKALNKTFTIIQGPPGTGKTVVGVCIVDWLVEMNSENPSKSTDATDKKDIVLYCGPSNKSVDVVAEYLLKFGDKLKPLRIYSQQVEMIDYPYPNFHLHSSSRTLRKDRAKKELLSITLHHLMRKEQNPHSQEIKQYDERIAKKEKFTAEEVKTYKKLLRDAREHELKQHNVILCTCTQSSSPSLTRTVNARQILIDECAMATEPQTLIPLVSNVPEKVILIGDHKQLQPVVKNDHVRKLGMARSLFERYYKTHEKTAVMLDTQYRMHEQICEFPSEAFYNGMLKTGREQPNTVLCIEGRTSPIVFGHIQGKTICQVTKTAKGNFNSKINNEERDKVIELAEKLVKNAQVKQQAIAILSPYNAQVSEIKAGLEKKGLTEISVSTITKSQGSEWKYVIISMVCSLPTEEIKCEHESGWMSKHLGSVAYPTQINVGITRAKEGLCIIGNEELLTYCETWRKLLQHYRLHRAVTDAKNISILRSKS